MPIRDLDRRDTLALVGGGRWARVIASVLADIELPFSCVAVVSRSNAAILGQVFSARRFARFAIVPTIEEALRRFRLGAAIIANAARAHVASAERMLGAGVPVLIEKPAALAVEEAHRLLEMADRNDVCVMPSLTFLHCSYVDRFAKAIGADGERLKHLKLDWADPVTEIRYGERKSYDPGISIAQDVVPHVWAILGQIARTPIRPDGVKSCRITAGGRWVSYSVEFCDIRCLVSIRRDAPARRRVLKAEMASGDELAIDFSVEPGTIIRGTRSESADPQWAERSGPLSRQLQDFFSALNRRTAEPVAQALLGSVALAERCDALLKERQRTWLARPRTQHDLRYALRDLLSARFYEQAHAAPGDAQALDNWLASALRRFHSCRANDIESLLQDPCTEIRKER
jgi:predicted dehydrogenase